MFNTGKDSDLITLPTKAELKGKQDKIKKLQAFDSSYFLGKNFLVTMVFRMFVYQSTLDTLELQ